MTNALAPVRPMGASALKWAGALALFRRRRRRPSRGLGLLGGGALLAIAGALLFGTKRGRSLSSRWGKSAGEMFGGKLGRVLGGQAGSHPLQSAHVAQKANELLSPDAE